MIVKPLLIKITSSNGTPMDVCMKVTHSIKFCKETYQLEIIVYKEKIILKWYLKLHVMHTSVKKI